MAFKFQGFDLRIGRGLKPRLFLFQPGRVVLNDYTKMFGLLLFLISQFGLSVLYRFLSYRTGCHGFSQSLQLTVESDFFRFHGGFRESISS